MFRLSSQLCTSAARNQHSASKHCRKRQPWRGAWAQHCASHPQSKQFARLTKVVEVGQAHRQLLEEPPSLVLCGTDTRGEQAGTPSGVG